MVIMQAAPSDQSAQRPRPRPHPEPDPAISPVAGLQIGFLQALPPAEQVRIFDLSIRASRTLHRWATRYPLIRRERVWPLSLSVAAASPFMELDGLIATARLSLWVFTLDDLFDEERVPQAELMRRADRYRAIAHGQSADTADDSLATALREVRDDLARYPLFAALGGGWAAALCGTIDGMLREYHWRLSYRDAGAAGLPSYDEYVETGLYSIGGPPHVWSALVAIGDPTTPDHLPPLRAMEALACTCIRLANDLQSYQKEVLEGKINAPILLTQQALLAGLSPEAAYRHAEARVRDHIRRDLDRLAELRAAPRTVSGYPEAAIDDIARFVCDFYVRHDYHTVSLKMRQSPGRPAASAARKEARA